DMANQFMHVVVPPLEILMTFFVCALLGPGLDLPIAAFHDAYKIHQGAPMQRVVNYMGAGPYPIRSDLSFQPLRQSVHGDHPTPCQATRIAGLIGTGQLASNARMNPIGADQYVTRNLAAIGQL